MAQKINHIPSFFLFTLHLDIYIFRFLIFPDFYTELHQPCDMPEHTSPIGPIILNTYIFFKSLAQEPREQFVKGSEIGWCLQQNCTSLAKKTHT